MTRRCSHCGQNGHNSRTCQERGVKLFGVRLTHASIRKSVSMGNLVSCSSASGAASPPDHHSEGALAADGCVSDGMVQTTTDSPERKKGTPWSEEEHRMFLLGLQKLGKGDWRGISRHFVTTRTPTQVASHAQKYFIRGSNLNKRKRRSSLFDITSDRTSNAIQADESSWSSREAAGTVPQPSLGQDTIFVKAPYFDPVGVPLSTHRVPHLPPLHRHSIPVAGTQGLTGGDDEQEGTSFGDTCHPPEHACTHSVSTSSAILGGNGSVTQSLLCPVMPFTFPVWPAFGPEALSQQPSNSKIVKPTAILSAAHVKMDVSNGISRLSLGISPPTVKPSSLSLKLSEQSSRNSAFHANPSFKSNGHTSGSNAISVV